MTTMIGRILQRKEEEYQVAVPSLSDLAEPGLTEKPAAPVQVEEVQGETLPPPSIATATADETSRPYGRGEWSVRYALAS